MAAATAMLVIAGVGMAINAYGQYKAGKAAKSAGESEAQQQEFNAQVAELQAQDALGRGAAEESRFKTGVRLLIGRQRAGFSGQGVDVGVGSAADVQADAAYLGELDAAQIRRNAEREAWGFTVEAADRRMAADVARKGGRAAATAAKIGAASTIIGGTTSLLSARYGWDRPTQVTRAA
jgi:general stress protein YciG